MAYATLEWEHDEVKKQAFIENLAPIVLFTYNRLDHTRQAIEALQKNIYAEQSELFIYSDAPKNEQARERVTEVRSYLKGVQGFKKVTIIERKKNWGLANSIIDGVTNIVNEYGKIIVLEDDIVTSKYFLKYMNDALEFYKGEQSIMQISGYLYPMNSENLPETFFLRLPLPWGWATWKDRWHYFKREPDYIIGIFKEKDIKRFNFNNTHNFWEQVLLNQEGKIVTWYIFWYATVFLNDGLVLYPNQSLVQNKGFDNSGEHCSTTNIYDTSLSSRKINIVDNMIQENAEARKYLEQYFTSIKLSFFRRVKNFLARNLKRCFVG